VWATWPASRHIDRAHYLARPSAGYGEAAAGDHLQLGWALWLAGHQLERGGAPWTDPYTFRPEAAAAANLQGWLLGIPFWPLRHLAGNVVAYDLVVLLSFVAAGGLTAWWLRALGLGPAGALVGGLAFELAPYRVAQSTGHLLGLVAFLLPALLLALERRRIVVSGLLSLAIPLSGQVHLTLGVVPLLVGYAWARLPRSTWPAAAAVPLLAAICGLVVQRTTIAHSIGAGTRSFAQVRHYSAHLADLIARSADAGVERLVFQGWLTPIAALAGIVATARLGRGLAVCLGLSWLIPVALALGSNNPLYEPLWHAFPPLRSARVPERLMPIACLATAGLVAIAVDRLGRRSGRRAVAVSTAAAALLLVVDLRVPLFGAVAADRSNAAYAALDDPGVLLELPIIRPDLHYGSVPQAYARQAPHLRPLGYSTIAPPAADRLARRIRGLSCGRGQVPAELGVRYVVVHDGLYRQTGFFGSHCAAQAARMLEAGGWRKLAADSGITAWERR
jgi:hypothetical protein